MPTTIISSDLAKAEIKNAVLTLHYTCELSPPGYFLFLDDLAGISLSKLGPFAFEDQAIKAAEDRFGVVVWREY